MSGLLGEEFSTRLLNSVQEEVPLVERPFQAIGQKLGVDEQQVIEQLTALHTGTRAIIRRVGAIFDSKSLGYQSMLVAAKVPPDHLDAAAAVINRHSGVSHNYKRENAYNLWYTLAVPPDSKLGLERTAGVLHKESGAIATRLLPTITLYKIGVKLNLSEDRSVKSDKAGGKRYETRTLPPLTETDKALIRVLQQDLPIVARPFDLLADQAGISTPQLLAAARAYIEQGRMRRFSGVLRHRELGFDANAMGVWDVPPDQQDEFGMKAAGFSAVSHCYLRPTYEDWPYSIFTMVHAKTREEGQTILKAISEATGVTRYGALYSTHEYKKIRVRYFDGEIERWEMAHQ